MLEGLTFVDSLLLITVFDLAAVRGKFSCKNTPKFTARPELAARLHRPLRAWQRTLRFKYARNPFYDGLFAVGGLVVTGVRFFYFYT